LNIHQSNENSAGRRISNRNGINFSLYLLCVSEIAVRSHFQTAPSVPCLIYCRILDCVFRKNDTLVCCLLKKKSYAQRRFISSPFKCAKVGCWFWLENLGHRRSLYHLAKRGNILISPRLHGSKLFVSIRSS